MQTSDTDRATGSFPHHLSLRRASGSRQRHSLRQIGVALLVGLTLLVGPISPLALGLGTGVPPVHAASLGNRGTPNRANPRVGTTSTLHLPPVASGNGTHTSGTPRPIAHWSALPMHPATLALSTTQAAHLTGSDGALQLDVPAGAVSASDLAAAGGRLSVQVTQIAPASGSNAGGSGIVSFGTYLLQVVDGQGHLVHTGLRKPITLTLHVGKHSAVDLTHAFAVQNGALPTGLTSAVAATATTPLATTPKGATPLAPKQLSLGTYSTHNTTFDAQHQALIISPLLTSPSTSMSFNTDSPVASWGKPDPFNVDLNAGALTSSFPIDVPAGPGGLTPPISLTYSSDAVSEQHSAQGAAPWVGEGWNLSLGAISWAEHNGVANCPVGSTSCSGAVWEDQWQLSDPFGTGSELIPPNINVSTYFDDSVNSYCGADGNANTSTSYPCPILWHTANDTYAKVELYVGPILPNGQSAYAPCFRVWLTTGIMEEFGCTADSLQYYYVPAMGQYLANWNLDLITDPHGNQIHLTYQTDPQTITYNTVTYSYQRDAVLNTIEWDSPSCHNTQTMCTGASWAPLMRVSFAAAHTPTWLTNSPSGCNTGSHDRCDDPVDLSGSNGLAAPEVQSTFALNEVLVQVRNSGSASWNTLHDYQLSYQQTGPTTKTDPATGKAESTAGQFLLTKLIEMGDDGATPLPTRTFGYSSVTEYYEDDQFTPNGGCGPAWNTGNGNGCLLWSQSDDGNSWYIASASNGLGLAQTFTWTNARDNAHAGTNSWASNPLYCNANQAGYPCNETDDQDWSHAVLTQQQGQVARVTQNGQGGPQTNTTITSTTAYTYYLSTPLAAQECGDCTAGFYWGNENETDYLDYYNGKYMGFAETDVSHSDGSLEKHHYYATQGWGVYDTTQVNCQPAMPPVNSACPNDPWWNINNVGHGHETEVDSYDTNGTTLLEETTAQYSATCPPSGVSATPATWGYGNYANNNVSELDQSNPVAVCALTLTRTDDFTFNGASGTVPDKTATYTYDSYGRPTTGTVSSNDGGATGSPTSILTQTTYIQNDNVSASYNSASGTYLVDFPALTYTADSSGNRYRCDYTSYDGGAYATGQQSSLTSGEVTATDRYATSCGTSGNNWTPSGDIRTTSTYDQWGNPLTADDPDANAGNTGHLGCTVGSTQYSTCDAYDATFDVLPTTSSNALNQMSSTGYGAQTSASTGFGLWPMAQTDTNGQTTSFTYDALGRMTSQTLPGETSGDTTASWTYTDWCSGTSAQAPCVELDETKRLNSTTTITNRAFYDGYGDLVETRNQGPAGQDVVAYAYYDVSGHMTFESNSYFVTAYSGGPGVAAFSLPDSTQAGTSTTYDGLERVKTGTDPLSNTTTTTLSDVCNPVTGDSTCYEQALVTDANHHQTAALTDALGRQAYVQDDTGNSPSTYAVYATTTYTYDENGNQTQILQPDGVHKTTNQYDLAGRQTGMTDPDRGTETYAYDQDGNLLQSVDARGASGTVYAGYDGLDRLLWRNSNNSPTNAYATFSYDSTSGGNDGVGRLTSETFTGGPNNTLSGAYGYSYDQRGQQISATLTIGSSSYPVQKTYDDSGNLLSQTYPDSEVVTTGYTAQGWFAGLATQQGSTTTTLVSSVTYSGTGGAASLMTGASLGNGLYTYAASYDLNHRLTSASITRTSDSAVMFQTQPSYDAVGNIAGVTTTLQAGTDNQAFCYDEMNRLTWASSQSGSIPCGGTLTAGTLTAAQYTQSFSYDTLGRLTSGPLGGYTYGSNAHLHAATAIGGTWTAAYDASGTMTCRAPTSSSTCAGTPTGAQLGYDNEGRLAAWQNAPSSPSATDAYLYDGEGNRVEQQVTTGLPGAPVTTTTVYVGNIEEVATAGSTTTTTTYYYAGPLRLAEAVNGTVSYPGSDTLGSADVALSGSGSGATQAAQLFAPYGSVRYASGAMPGSYGFTGQRADAATGLDYYGARYYDPLAGQFVSADPAGDGLNLYAYVKGNPETRTDPTGLYTGGVCGGGSVGIPGLGVFGEVCFVVGWDPNAGWSGGITLTGGGPANTGWEAGGALSAGVQISNAATVDDLGGPFTYGGIGGSIDEVGAYGTGFGGRGTHGQAVGGLEGGWQGGLNFDLHAGESATKVIDFNQMPFPFVIAKASGTVVSRAVNRAGQQFGRAKAWAGQQVRRAMNWANSRRQRAETWFDKQVAGAQTGIGQQFRAAQSWVGQQFGAAQSWVGQQMHSWLDW